MALVYCDRDGRVLAVTGFTGDQGPQMLPPAGEAFSVGIPDEQGRKIAKAPRSWRFAEEGTYESLTKFRYLGGKSASPAMEGRCQRASNAFADRVAAKRTRVAAEAAEHQRLLDVAAMAGKRTIIDAPFLPGPYTYDPRPAPPPRARSVKSTKKTKKAKGKKR